MLYEYIFGILRFTQAIEEASQFIIMIGTHTDNKDLVRVLALGSGSCIMQVNTLNRRRDRHRLH